jgi:gliding motility-associated-like protein
MKNKVLSSFIAILLIFGTKSIIAQAPNLGTAANFILFTSTGAVTNSGIGYLTILNGNVGTNSAPTITGFGNINGRMHYTADAISAQCQADLTTAVNQLNSTTPNFFPPIPIIGNGDTLRAGVYSITNSTISLSGNLILDGQGNPNAVFIFKLQGALSSNTNTKVKLINGALACNVFWKVDGAVSLSSGTTMRGTIIANNGAINISSGDTLEGRALTTTGAITVSELYGYLPAGCGSLTFTGPSAPVLASVGCYATFTSIGANTNTGSSTIDGDVGTNSGLTVGYNPLLVNGTIHAVPDGSTAAAVADLANAYNYLNGLAPGNIELLFPAQFGHNLELTPHVYLMNSAVTFTDTVILNAKGNADAVFVILVNGAFGTSVNSRVLLINGAQAKNVYWKIDGALTINNNSIFNGTVVNAGAISVNTGANVNGRVLSINGALNIAAATVSITSTTIPFPLLNTGVCLGDSAKLILGLSGNGYTYQWRKGNVNLSNSLNISGVNSDTLKIYPFSFTDTSSFYNVIITNNCAQKDTSAFYKLLIDLAPTITTEPSSQIVCLGDTATFSIEASGTNLAYQWRKGNTNLVNGMKYSGVNNDTLLVNGLDINDTSSDYNVIVFGVCSSNDTSNYVSLKKNVTTQITSEPDNQVVCILDSITFKVMALGTNLTYQWRKGNVNLLNSIKLDGVNSNTLTIRAINNSDTASNYNVIVYGICSSNDTSIMALLSVNQKPNITSEPTNQSACENDSTSFSIVSNGLVQSYQWRKGNVNLINNSRVYGANSSKLTIRPLALSDSGSDYNLIISGFCNTSDTSNNAALKVHEIPIAFASSNTPVCLDSTIKLNSNTIAGSTYLWTGPNSFTTNSPTPVIRNASAINAGLYSLIITTNNCRSTPSNINILIDDCKIADFFIPEGFSPNGDGINDVFFIRGLHLYPNNSFEIYNRWGEKLYGASPYLNDWNGTCTDGLRISSNKLPVGTYFYLLNLGNNTPTIKGYIYLNN